MKKLIKILSVFLAVIMAFASTSVAFASTKFYSKYDKKTYTHNTKFDTFNKFVGIDVSMHNKTVDFNKVKADGIDFVYVRVGYTGYTKKKLSLNYDPYYQENITNALAAGLQVGVYWYSQALNEEEALQEANMLLNVIGSYNITMPVVYDYEFAGVGEDGRLDSANLSKAQMTANSLAFLNRVSQMGYTPCLYANYSFLKNRVNVSQISSIAKIWLAHYNTSTDYPGDYEYWQYTSDGRVNGISGRVDMNVWYQGAQSAVPTAPVTPNVTQPTAKKVTGVKLKAKTNTTLTFSWASQNYAEYYNIYKYDSKKGKYVKVGTTAGNVNTFKVRGLPEGSYFRFKITAVVGGNEGARSEPYKVVTNPRKVQTKLAKSTKKRKITFKWKKTTGTGYQYQWSTSKKFKKNYLTKTTKKTNVTISTSKSRKTYYVRVRAYKTHSNGKKYYGKWSTVKKVKVK
jgi:GH25 family lysozyme M1 (1,4-beta-N-acetylmuramidase)